MTVPTQSLPDRVGIAVAGAGVIGRQHGKVISELDARARLVAVVDPVLERAEAIVAERGGQAFGSLTEALDSDEFDVVAVCTPTGAHGEVAIQALDAGKHVIIEKPAETTLAKTDAIIAAQRRAGTLVTVISQHRFDPATEITIDAIRRGRLGRLTSGIASIDWWRGQSYYDSGDWRGTWELDGGGALMNQGVHTVDLLVAALGRPLEVFAYTATLAHQRIETEDVAVGVIKFGNGALGLLHATTAAFPGLSARLQIHGDRGSVVIDNDELTFIHLTAEDADAEERAYGTKDEALNQLDRYRTASTAGPTAGSDPGQLSNAHHSQYENFLAALRGEEEIRVGLAENRQSISVIVGVYESARTGRPVRLDAELGSPDRQS